ncbi:MAG TPA: ATP-binding protein, partial [Anaerolineales bacterium]|nr:ATP-binding protein [Anaerolineales bacterium]
SEDVSIQTTLAAQVAAALQNARSYEQAEKALRELNTLTRRLTREGWNAYLETQPSSRLSYAYDLSEIVPLDADDRAAESNGKAIERPLTLHGETIGRVTIAEAEKVDEEAQAVVAAVAEQLTAHIENLRLTEQALAAQQQSELRAVELEAIAKVSAAASTILDADTLLQTVVDLTKESLALYHAHIYLLDETGDALILAAGAGEVGRKMAATGRSIPVNREHSLVARAARTRRGVIANDVGQEPDFLPNPLLPNTRSEMAVPMILGDALLGVFDVQADTINRFSAEDVRLKTTLAEQVAVALQNARLYAEQASTVERLRELDQLKSSFLANMSHELRTPLNSILGFTQVMLEGIDGDLNERMENDLAIIQNNGQHLLNLISDILDMAKIEAGKMTLNPEIFDLKEVLDEVLDITGPLARAKSLDLIVNAGSESAMDLYADRMRLRQVMINLVNNAIKFTESGYIEIAAGRPEGLFRIAVRDTGISIPVDHLETIFQEFSQVDSSTTRKTGGTGLGLPISRHLIELHGGRLWAESTGILGEGSSFIIELPVEAPYEDGNLTPKTQPVQ